MPFLILAVGLCTTLTAAIYSYQNETGNYFLGVDDAFLLLGAWRMTDIRWSVERRMGATMSDAGASITVTSLTNFGCFGRIEVLAMFIIIC
jgi:hypothetical protein